MGQHRHSRSVTVATALVVAAAAAVAVAPPSSAVPADRHVTRAFAEGTLSGGRTVRVVGYNTGYGVEVFAADGSWLCGNNGSVWTTGQRTGGFVGALGAATLTADGACGTAVAQWVANGAPAADADPGWPRPYSDCSNLPKHLYLDTYAWTETPATATVVVNGEAAEVSAAGLSSHVGVNGVRIPSFPCP